MIQATNELILGMELNEQYVQLTYYHQSVHEPVTLGTNADAQQYRMPNGLRLTAQGRWQLFDGTPQIHREEPDQCRICGVYGKADRGEIVEENGHSFEPEEILSIYFECCMAGLKLLTQNTKLQVMVTVKELTEERSSLLTEAWMRLGLARRDIYVQDYLSSFYYYTVNQKKELWQHDAALFTYEDEAIVAYILHIDKTTKPAIAKAECVARQSLDDSVRAQRTEESWNQEKDRLFFELLKKAFERRMVSVAYLLGDYFDKSWVDRSLRYLCQRRHAFQGMNLYSKGACYAAMERAGLTESREILYSGRDMIGRNLSMELRVRGKTVQYPLINAGVNWYEAHQVCELIPDEEREIRVVSASMTQGNPIVHVMRLDGMPQRPNRATRLRLTVYFTSPVKCHIEVEDLGFGGFFRSSGLVWHRELLLDVD